MRKAFGKGAVPLVGLGLAALFFASTGRTEEIPNVADNGLSQSVYSEGPTQIPGLIWSGENGQPDFTIEAQKNGKPAARVHGKFASKNAGTLLFSSSILQRAQYSGDAGDFTVLIPLTSRKTPVKVQYIDDYGNKNAQDIEIVYENFFQFQLNQATKKRWNFDVGSSLSYLDYKQEASNLNVKITQMGLTPKFGVTYNLGEKLDLGASAFGTLVGLPMSQSPEGLQTPRFYGINGRIGYRVYGLKTGNIYLMTGLYLWGMVGTGSTNPDISSYGVQRLSGPQLFLVGRFLTSEGRTFVSYVKAATITDGVGGMAKNRELAIGMAYQITPPKSKRRFMMNLDFASARFDVLPAATTTDPNPTVNTISLNSISLGISTPL